MTTATITTTYIRQMIRSGRLDELHAELLTGDAESYPTLLDGKDAPEDAAFLTYRPDLGRGVWVLAGGES